LCGLDHSALLSAITVPLNRRVRIVDPIKGIDFDKVRLRRWLVDYKIAQRETVPPTAAFSGTNRYPPTPARLPDMRKGDPEAAPVPGEAGKNKSAARTGLFAAADEDLLANFETLPQNL
jgi:hypothetical protein